ncbi:alpha-L-fucosidase [Clostridium sp. AF19-22AC]|jgi:alpha-L-fucosidase|uniref:alpha-L-fucosidase n=1 Tax=Clostridia TaxID=186801 RepID=UPI000E4F3082|nr:MULTISPECIES: alpha-L-fucosidase [Clostridia]RHR33118.1 alpha-L-fucosidase [Clostridium sp. AF19-22AC]
MEEKQKKTSYEANWESLKQHEPSEWFKDSKFGIFVHWGVYSVPAWAPTNDCQIDQYTKLHGTHPYAEIYLYCMRFRNSPFWKHHVETYGSNFHYDDFIPMFQAENYHAEEWADLFREAGAKYSVMVTKHSDDFAMWPTEYSDRNAFKMGPHKDLVGEFAEAMRSRDLKLGLYFTWCFNVYYSHYPSFPYTDYIHAQAKELIDTYHPDLFWPDAEYAVPRQRVPAELWRSEEMISYFYNQAKDPAQVLVNDRWGKVDNERLLGDYMTPEYASMDGIPEFYWETTRGIGRSFGYNQMEGEEDYASVKELVHILVDNVSKNGNLLLNVGPKADGTIPDIQKNRLLGIGRWLKKNGEAIYGTRHWVHFGTTTKDEIPIRYTKKGDTVYAIALERPTGNLSIPYLYAKDNTVIRGVAANRELEWRQKGNELEIILPENLEESEAYAFSISPEPYCLITEENKPKILKVTDLQVMGLDKHW